MHDALLAWYAVNKRSLPWRDNPAPYAVLISEVMAQQTRMAQLLPFYIRFMERFPTLDDLRESDLDEVLAAWAGMGYYARARNLHRAAQIIQAEYGDGWPRTRAQWEALPGIGPYTAGAIMAIAFGQREAAVDGNVLRLYARLAKDATDIATPAAKSRAGQFIVSHMGATDVSAYTQALMELGALVCVPSNPKCGVCPLAYMCQARLAGCERDLPVKARKGPSPGIPVMVLLIFSPDGRVLMRRRTEGLLRGMWVYCLSEGQPGEAPSYTQPEAAAHAASLGYTVTGIESLGEARHAFTHRVWDMIGFAVYVRESHGVDDYLFLTPDELEKTAVPAAMRYFTVPMPVFSR
jgi:A/G-specific adenine glycosylase